MQEKEKTSSVKEMIRKRTEQICEQIRNMETLTNHTIWHCNKKEFDYILNSIQHELDILRQNFERSI